MPDENVDEYTKRLVCTLKQIPVEVVLPPCLVKEHNRLFERFEALKKSDYAPPFEELAQSQVEFIQPLYKQIFRAAKNTIRLRASRSISRLLSIQIENHYHNFFLAVDNNEPLKKSSASFPSNPLASIPARLTIFGDITLRLKLKDQQREPRVHYSTDLRQVELTLNQVEEALWRLFKIAREVIDRKLLRDRKVTQEQEDCLEGIKYDLKSLWMIGFESGLRRLERLLQSIELESKEKASTDVARRSDPY